jgi:DNA-directed RNA polymerase specialized sigma24 family protein
MEPLDREVLALRHFEELNNGEVAQVLDRLFAFKSPRG